MSREIIKPYKIVRQKKESQAEATELIRFVSQIAKGNCGRGCEPTILSNKIDNPRDFIENPEKIAEQMIGDQNASGIFDYYFGRRVYAVTYQLPKDKFNFTNDEMHKIGQELINKYPTFQSVLALSSNKTSNTMAVVFNNCSSSDCSELMTKVFRPYHATNIINKHLERRQ